MTGLYKKTEQFVIDSFTKANDSLGIKHSLRTVYWMKKLNPDAEEALLISAVAHDIERAFRSSGKGFSEGDHLKHHQEEGARIMGDFLEKNGSSKAFIDKVKSLITRHEAGGDSDQDMLKDADSLSFFENNAVAFVNEKAGKMGKEKVKEKFDWMFERMTSDRAKQIAKPLYEEAIRKLENMNFLKPRMGNNT